MSSNRWYYLVATVWLCGVLGGYRMLVGYKAKPGPEAHPPSEWPAASTVPRSATLPTLLLVVHPKCPCTDATVSELGRLLARVGSQVATHVLFVEPPGTPAEWGDTRLRRAVAAMPSVAVRTDVGGVEAARFQLTTSGSALLYSRDGRLLFAGGLTSARGHEGDSVGKDSLKALIEGASAATPRSPVFGCPLTEADADRRVAGGS